MLREAADEEGPRPQPDALRLLGGAPLRPRQPLATRTPVPDAEVGRLMAKSTPSMFVPLDVNYMRDPRIRRAGPDAELLYLRALAYAKGGETDGFVHDFDLDAIASGLRNVPQRVAALVREKAWEEREDGWFITGWFKWNESTEKLRDKKRRQADGAAKTNHRKHIENSIPFIGSCGVCLGEVDL